jgi:hypothetical protein
LLAGCTGATSSGGTPFEADGVRFEVPSGWSVRESRLVSRGAVRVLLYIANQPMRDDCLNDPSGESCQLPIDELPRGGIFMWWRTDACVAAGCNLPAGESLAVGRREAVRAVAPGACAGMEVTGEQLVAVAVTPQRVDTIYICERDPEAAGMADVQSILDSIVWRTP